MKSERDESVILLTFVSLFFLCVFGGAVSSIRNGAGR